MPLGVWLVLIVLTGLSAYVGEVRVAVALGGLKALVLGWAFMELRHADRAHLAAYVAFVALVVGLLEVWL